MRRWLILATCAVTAAACRDQSEPAAPHSQPAATLTTSSGEDPALAAALATASPTDQLEVIVTYDEATTTADAVTDGVLQTGAGVIGFKHLPMVAALATPDQIAAIKATQGVEGVWFNRQLQYTLQDSRTSMKADSAHMLSVSGVPVTGKGVGIAILDTGIDGLYNPDLAYPAKTVANVKWVAEWRDLYYTITDLYGDGQTPRKPLHKGANIFVENLSTTETSTGHGTHVAGISAGDGTASGGKYKGIAPDANLIGIGAGDILFVFWILSGFDYIIDRQQQYNIQVVNNSWGSSGEFNPKDPINKATKKVYEKGITVVFAAGNCGKGEDPSVPGVSCPTPDQTQLNPYSVAPWVIGVAAGCKTVNPPRRATNGTTRCEDAAGREPVLADFSSRGLDGRGEYYEPDITAPGVYIVSTRASGGTVMNAVDADEDLAVCKGGIENLDYYTCASGTSMASPQIAGLVALLEQASGGTLTPDQALRAVKATARPLTGYKAYEVGAGYADALAAVKYVMQGKHKK